MHTNLDLLALSFAMFNGLRLVSYVPQIFVLARDTSGARSISLASYMIWTGANATTALYVWSRLGDAPVAMLNAVNTLCCVVVIALTLYKRTQSRLAGAAPSLSLSAPT
ncbi:MAG: hypothetical protein EKK41_02815 [Hyphomicrobiales bacterium]|nr:MAG: hypothetical protein EKK41_02815 [Hyphomicrobiales bacterium]